MPPRSKLRRMHRKAMRLDEAIGDYVWGVNCVAGDERVSLCREADFRWTLIGGCEWIEVELVDVCHFRVASLLRGPCALVCRMKDRRYLYHDVRSAVAVVGGLCVDQILGT